MSDLTVEDAIEALESVDGLQWRLDPTGSLERVKRAMIAAAPKGRVLSMEVTVDRSGDNRRQLVGGVDVGLMLGDFRVSTGVWGVTITRLGSLKREKN